ncbi:hypothetical protein [Nonomuraea rhizosphaerae]|uniref:hypothetical protein n=1 Tax=Nonomuraea rhizosphaerae TaxID=2665663 RepID=UPI001C5F99B8|nr:hypothetical protein [Nonomuraea rhizosphaerae]
MSVDLRGTRLGVVRGISYGLFGKPDSFVPEARELGAGLVRAYVYWSQVEPAPGHYTWDTVDALLDQLGDDMEVWITLCSSSPWATRTPTDFLPPSPARDLAAYGSFVRAVVRRCAGRVAYWQCDNEPSNTDLLWAGTAPEYVAQLKVMHTAVKEADPAAAVVLGGCGYDVLSAGPDDPPALFFDHLVSEGRDHFDLFDVHLYGDAATVPASLERVRRLMLAHGCLRPIVVGEYAAPVPFEFPDAGAAMREILMSAFTEAPAAQSTSELAGRQGQDTPELRAMTAMYERMASLPPELQMFLEGCPEELEARRHRINVRQLVMGNLFALAEGVRRTVYWNLAPEVPQRVDPRQVMHLMFGKLALLAYEGDRLSVRRPAADAFDLLTERLAGVVAVRRAEHPLVEVVEVFEVTREGRGPLVVLWQRGDVFSGEDEPPVTVEWPWGAGTATAVDAFGEAVAAEVRDGVVRDGVVRDGVVRDGVVRVTVSVTPVYLSAS